MGHYEGYADYPDILKHVAFLDKEIWLVIMCYRICRKTLHAIYRSPSFLFNPPHTSILFENARKITTKIIILLQPLTKRFS